MKNIRALGLMSGTSMDGLDCGLFDIVLSYDYKLEWKCLDFKVIPYSQNIRRLIINSLSGDEKFIIHADIQLGEIFTTIVAEFLNNRKVDVIASHGQTISHEDGILTRQIGSPKTMYKVFQVPVVFNVRQADIDAGGNGAPLMPFLDWLLYKESGENIITLNLGGIANISYIPESGNRDEVMGFDTGPGMSLMDETCREMLGIYIDQDGLNTARGNIDRKLLDELIEYEYITKKPPKSTGRGEFGSVMVKRIIQDNPHISTEDMLRTFCAFTAKSIAVNLKGSIDFDNLNPLLIISGGGVRNPVLMDDIMKYVSISNIKKSDDYGIESKMKESMLMAVLAVARMMHLPANMPSVTGALRQTFLGDMIGTTLD